MKHGYTQNRANNGKHRSIWVVIFDIVKLLLEHGAEQTPCKDGTTPIIMASRYGHINIVEILLKYRATHKADKLGRTLVYWASIRGHVMLTKMLLKDEYMRNEDQITIASELGYDEALKLLVEYKEF